MSNRSDKMGQSNVLVDHVLVRTLWWYLYLLAASILHRRTSYQLLVRMWSMTLGRNQIMVLRCGAPIPVAFQPQKHDSNSSTESIKSSMWGSRSALKLSEIVLWVSLPITSKALLMFWMWLGYTSIITLQHLLLQAICPIESEHVATPLHMYHCEDGMHWLDSCSRIGIVGGYLSGTLESGWIGETLGIFGEVLYLFLVCCILYNNISDIHTWRALLTFQDVGIRC